MMDNENVAEIILRKLSITSTTNDCRSRSTSNADNFAVSYHGSVTSAVSLVNDDIVENNEDLPIFSNRQIYKNLVILSVAILILFTAYVSIVSLQSSLNAKGNVGINALVVMNTFILFGSLFLANVAMDIFGLKWSLVIGSIAYIFYIGANVRPTPILMYTSAASIGIVSAPFWASQATYISRIASYHAQLKKKDSGPVISLFFGIFFAIFGTSAIWGNLVSYFVLHQNNAPQRFNCGVHFNPISDNTSTIPSDVSDTTRYVLCGIFVGMGILAMIMLLAVDQIRLSQRQPPSQSLKKSFEVIRSFFRWQHIDQLFLVPITMWTMIENGFILVQFTRAFITCLVGIRYIGLVLTFGGICTAIFSYIFGGLVKYIGRPGCILIAAALNYASILSMYYWEPRDDQMYILYLVSCVWGTADAVWTSQVVAVYTVLYSETDSSAIAKYRLWKGAGSLVAFTLATYFSIANTLIILLGFLTVAIIGYGIVEIRARWKTRIEKSKMSLNVS